MRALPDTNDSEAMILAGKRSVIGRARKEACEALRDACTFCQSAEWGDITQHAEQARAASERLKTLDAMWQELK
jgi:predicted ATPase